MIAHVYKLILLLLASVPGYLSAQTEKSSFIAGGTAAFYNLRSIIQDQESYGVNLNPDLGYFFADNWAAGVALPIGWQHSGGEPLFNYGINPFLRHYLPQKDRLALFFEINGGFRVSNLLFFEDNFLNYNIAAGPGLVYFITKNTGIEAFLNYSYSGSEVLESFSRIGLDFGIQFYFNRNNDGD